MRWFANLPFDVVEPLIQVFARRRLILNQVR